MEIHGVWRAGFALDYQTISSVCIGYNEYGHPVFDTIRTELGELLYRLKYGVDKSVVDELVEAAAGFLEIAWKLPLTMIVPMSPSDETRVHQPVLIVANALGARLTLPVRRNAVAKIKRTPQLKNVYEYEERLRLLSGSFSADPSLVAGQRVLLFDDLYRSGATMNSVTKVLYEQGKADEVYTLAITRTRKNS